MSEPLVSNVSDTARWVAVYRAWESARPDALFHDPYADMLAGERGRAIAAEMPRQTRSGWPIIARTKLIDDLIQKALAQGCDCILNLAAGLDTRPYRLELPPKLRWIEADLPALIEEKERLLAAAQPHCQLQRIKIDLADRKELAALLREAVGSSTKTLVITEGLLIYLDEPSIRALTVDLAAQPGILWWLFDLASPELVDMLDKRMGEVLANAPIKYAPANGVAYFEALGWKVIGVHSLLHAAARFGRLSFLLRLLARLPAPNPRRLARARWYGIVELGRPAA